MGHRKKVQLALDESRMLVLGLQVLLGFVLQLFLMPQYERFPRAERGVTMTMLVLLLAALILVMLPTAHHRLVDRGEDTVGLDRVTKWALALVLFPFAAALGGAFFVGGARLGGRVVGLVFAAITFAGAIGAWYVWPLVERRDVPSPEDEMTEPKAISLDHKIGQVLTEARVVLPGTQALLGFQLAGIFQSGFDKVSLASKLVYLVGFVFLGVSVVVLLLPAAYHRIAEQGENSERLHRVSSICIVVAMVTLAGAIACDVAVVVDLAVGSTIAAMLAAAGWLVASLSAWVFAMLIVRARRRRRAGRLPLPTPAAT